MYIYIYTCMFIYTFTYMHIDMYSHTHTHKQLYVYRYIYRSIHKCLHIYAGINLHIHTYMQQVYITMMYIYAGHISGIRYGHGLVHGIVAEFLSRFQLQVHVKLPSFYGKQCRGIVDTATLVISQELVGGLVAIFYFPIY